MHGKTRWLGAVSFGLLLVSLVAGAAPGGAGSPTSTVAQATPRAAAPAFEGALPESYPWVRLAEKLTPAVVNVRTVGEVRRSRTPNIPEPFRRFFPQPPEGSEREQQPPRPRGVGSGFIIDA
jgi:serine protease Do